MTTTRVLASAAVALVLAVAGIDTARAAGGEIKLCVRPAGQVYMVGEGFHLADCHAGDTLVSWSAGLVARTGSHTFFLSSGRLHPGLTVAKSWLAPAGSYFVIARVRFGMFGSPEGPTKMRCNVNGYDAGALAHPVDGQGFDLDPDQIDPPPPPGVPPYDWTAARFASHREMILTGTLAYAESADVEMEIACHPTSDSLGDVDVEVLTLQMIPVASVEPGSRRPDARGPAGAGRADVSRRTAPGAPRSRRSWGGAWA